MPSLTTYKLLKQEHNARRGEFKTVHGTVQTPAFQNVATAGAIKGGLSAHDLKDIGAQVMLCNTYHLHLRPGDKLVAEMAVCTSLPAGTAPSSPTAADFRCSASQSCARSPRRA